MQHAASALDDSVRIGEASALFDLPPSTLRWWEQAGVLARPAVEGGQRRYREDDLRRIGLAYICHVVGMMPLSATATVTSGRSDHSAWQHTIRTQIERLDQLHAQIDVARRNLRHLLQCVDDDPVVDCPFLAAEIVDRTPRGRVAEADLLRAARASGRPRATDDEMHGNGADGDEMPSVATGVAGSAGCPVCRSPVACSGRGRPRRYCSAACRQRAYRSRDRSRRGHVHVVPW